VWGQVLKAGNLLRDNLMGVLSPYLEENVVESFFPMFDRYRDSGDASKRRQFLGIIDLLALYKQDKDKFIQENYPTFRPQMDISLMKRKMDMFLERYGTKKRQVGNTPRARLNSLAKEIKEGGSTEKINEFLKLAQKHLKILEDDSELRQLQRDLEKIDKGSILYFKAGNPPKRLLEKFAKIIRGKVHWLGIKERSWVIHYPNLTVGEWMKNWNSLFLDFTGEGSMGRIKPTSLRTYAEEFKRLSAITDNIRFKKILNPILVEIKSYVPTIESAGVSRKLTIPDAKFYEVSDFTSQMLRDYLEIISKTKSLDVNSLLPKGEDMKISDGGEQRTVPVSTIKELLFATATGGNLRSNPYMSLILTEIEGVNWFSQLMSLTRGLEILDRGKMKALMMDDIGEGFDLELEESPIFGLPLHKDDDSTPKTKEKFKAFMSKKIDIFDTAEMVNEDIEGTISLKMKTSLDDAIEEIGVARLKEALSQVRGLETPIVSVSFKRKTVKGLERFEVYDGERSLNDAEINIVIDTVKKLGKDIEGLEGKLQVIDTQKAVNDLLQSGSFTQLMLTSKLEEEAKTPLPTTTSLSSLSPKNLIPFFVKLDEMLGYVGENSVLDYYAKIDNAPKRSEKRKLSKELEQLIGNRIESYSKALQYFFEERLRNIINSKGIGDGRGQLPKKLLDKLVDRNIVTEVSS